MFIPLSFFHHSYYLLLGSVISIAYSYGVSDYQEYQDMEKRFNLTWANYKQNIPKWRFLWKPKYIPKGTIYFDFNCTTCSSVKNWFLNQNTINLEIKSSTNYKGKTLMQATYIDIYGNEYKSIKAIAHALEHINLAYANLGWLLRFPIITHLFQFMIDSMDLSNQTCTVKN